MKVVLVVEDEVTDQLLVVRALQRLADEVKVVTVDTGGDALDYVFRRGTFVSRLASESPDLVLLDHSLGDMTGLDVLKSIRDNPESHRLRVVVLSARHVNEDRKKYDLFGVSGFVVKPDDPEEFKKVVLEIVETQLAIKAL